MKHLTLILIAFVIISCATQEKKPANPMVGSWKLLTGTQIAKDDTVITDYTVASSFIKIINDTHFAFLLHDLKKGQMDAPVFSSGGGTYSYKDGTYTEHLEYCTARDWEGHDFTFNIEFKGDTMIQSGVEKIDSLGVDRMNIETYVRIK
jgi:hypothetical protein